jgi:hypothetical protein
MRLLWGSSYGFPQPLPTAPFKRYIMRHEIEASHYYSAYPEATATMVTGALAIDLEFEMFRRVARELPPELFARRWQAFLTNAQAHL